MSMSRRDILHRKHLDTFAAFAETLGWQSEPTKGFYEVLRLRKGKTVHMFYERTHDRQKPDSLDGSTHITVDDRAMPLVRNFLKAKADVHD